MAFCSHCQFKSSPYSGGQGQVTQLGYLEESLSPGQPEKSMTTGTPSFSASRIVLRVTSSFALAITLFGCSGLPWQLRALIEMPLSSSFALNSLRAVLFFSISRLQCGPPG